MCILFWTVDNHPKYKFIFAGNRDEFLRRPTARAKFWESNENILAGVDLESHPMETIKDGTWLGLTRQGRFAALTNYRETKFIGAMSRGVLVKDFLCGSDSVTTTLEHIKEHQDDYGGFSLICFDFGKQETDMAYLTNRENQPLFQLNPKEIYGLSNSTLDNPWPKVTKGREMFQNIVQTYDEKQMIESLFDMLKTGEHLQRTDDVPSILADLRERIFIPKFDFSSNTRLKEPSYATRTSTIVLIDNDGNATFVERDWYNDDFLPLKPGEYDDRLFKFQLQMLLSSKANVDLYPNKEFEQDYLDSNVGEEDIEEEEVEQEAEAEMPSELSTPISLSQQNRVVSEEKKNKKKKKKKNKTAHLPEAGSALADDYVENNQEDAIEDPFDPERPLSQRVEYAIWKYRKNHKFTESRRAIFDNYLKFGGINTGPNMFLGRATSADASADPEADVDVQATKLAIDSVPDELEEGMEVNFSEVAQVYFGNTFIRESRFITMQEFIDAPNLIDAFLRYLQIRNVAPEYADDIEKARAIVAQAKIELPKCKSLTLYIPGNFNSACAVYFGERETTMDLSWMNDSDMKTQKMANSFLEETLGMTREEASKIVKSQIKDLKDVKLVTTLEWVGIKVTDLPPISSEEDPEALLDVTFTDYENNRDTYIIKLEKKIVENLTEGMVTRATLCKLDNGRWYLEKASRIMPSFFMEDDCLQEEDYEY